MWPCRTIALVDSDGAQTEQTLKLLAQHIDICIAHSALCSLVPSDNWDNGKAPCLSTLSPELDSGSAALGYQG